MQKKNKTLTILGTLVSLFVIILFIESIIFREQIQALITDEAEGLGYFFVILVSAILELVPQFIAPTVLMLNAAILNISLLETTIFIIIGSTLGGVTGYIAGRKLGKGFAIHTFGKGRVKKVERSLNSYGKWFVMFAALTPLPYVPIIFGALGMTKKNITIFGFIPRAISYIIFWILLELGINVLFSP